MCYHISLSKPQLEIEDRFKARVEDLGLFQSFFHRNGFSNEPCYVITSENSHIIDAAVWGLKPSNLLATDSFQFNTLNAKSETVLDSTLFRESVLERRCLVLADGFFESKHVKNQKYPHYIYLKGKPLFAFAGLYNEHKDGQFSCSILTTKANAFMADIHNTKQRMPLILEEAVEGAWLNETLNEKHIKDLIATCFTKKELQAHTVAKAVNNARIDSNFPEVLQPYHYPELQTLF